MPTDATVLQTKSGSSQEEAADGLSTRMPGSSSRQEAADAAEALGVAWRRCMARYQEAADAWRQQESGICFEGINRRILYPFFVAWSNIESCECSIARDV